MTHRRLQRLPRDEAGRRRHRWLRVASARNVASLHRRPQASVAAILRDRRGMLGLPCNRSHRYVARERSSRRLRYPTPRRNAGRDVGRGSEPVASAPMTLPTFPAATTPGPRSSTCCGAPAAEPRWADQPHDSPRPDITHGTTVLGVRYADGVVMAGDRRATSGNLIATSTMEKVFPADRFSGVAIAGAAGPGGRDGEAVPAAARALREGGGHRPQPRGQGQPARADGAQQPPGRHAGPRRSCRCSPATTCAGARGACSSTTSPAAATRSRDHVESPAPAACTPARS